MKELILNSYYVGGRCCGPAKSWFVTVSYLGRCGGHEITDL